MNASETGSRTWVDAPNQVDDRYQRAYSNRGGKKGATGLDLYFAREPVERPLVVFHHIPKTAGTSVRNVIHSNHEDAEFEIRGIDVDEELPDQLRDWYADLWESLGEKRDRLICAAGHYAAFFLPVVRDRPIETFTVLRDPVDRVISRYYFFNRSRRWSLRDLYEDSERQVLRGANFERGRFRAFFNGESRTILQPFYETESLPLTGDEPACDLWRERLFELVDERFVVGVQERFVESLQLLGERFGWSEIYPATARVNRDRPAPEEFPPATIDLIRAYNWLDVELHERHLRRIDPEARLASALDHEESPMTEDEQLEQESGEEEPRKRKRGGGRIARTRRRSAGAEADYGAMASRALARAQRAWDEADSQGSAEADFHLRTANVLATLELARAFRSRAGQDESG